MAKHDSLLVTAERIASLLADRGIDAVVIGAAALAAHHYVRHTEDIDLGVNIAIKDLGGVAAGLRKAGYDVVVREPDGKDPLGGVIDVGGPSASLRPQTPREGLAPQSSTPGMNLFRRATAAAPFNRVAPRGEGQPRRALGRRFFPFYPGPRSFWPGFPLLPPLTPAPPVPPLPK